MADEQIDVSRDPRLQDVPRGALVLAGIAVGLLLLAWLIIYLFVFIPRGMVG
jgi:hypothetical protein